MPMSVLKQGLYRVVHAGLFLSAKLVPFPLPEVLEGPGSAQALPPAVKARGLERVLVVTDDTLRALPPFAALLAGLEAEGIATTVFSSLQANPTIANVEAARDAYVAGSCQGVVAFGGGSPIDCAKAAAARVTNRKTLREMAGLFKIRHKLPPFFAIPTTAGTGSEVTIVAVITDPERREKFAIADPKLVPDVAVLDPEVMVGLPPFVTATTGMDALTHALEAYVGRAATSKTEDYAESAVASILAHLERAYRDGSDLEARAQMARASFSAGAAFTKSSVGYVHAIAHKLGGLYGTPHGLANAVVLPVVLDWYGASVHRKLARLAVLGGLGTDGEPRDVLAGRLTARVREMNRSMGIPEVLRDLRREDIPAVAECALREANPMYPVPRIMDTAACEELLAGLVVS